METCHLPARFPATPLRLGRRDPPAAIRSYRPDPESRKRMLVLGLGFVGKFFAQHLKEAGWVVSGTCTSDFKKKELEKRGIDVHLFDANEPVWSVLDNMKHHTHLLISIPTVPGIGDPMLRHEDLLRRMLPGGDLQWLCYLSSTSVYGDCAGALVDEDYLARPTTETGKLRLAAEKRWLNLGYDIGLSTQVFRLGGIYGPGRSAVDTIIKQKPLSDGQKQRTFRQFTSRVHVEDICQALEAAIENPSARRIYNIVDNDPAPREEVYAYALDLIERRWPGKIKQTASCETSEVTRTWSVPRGEKRVCNARMKRELGVRLLYPSYKLGLKNIIEQMENPF